MVANKAHLIYTIGERVFAKVRGYPPWPAKVQSVSVSRTNEKYNVYFYGTAQTALCKPEDLYRYEESKVKLGGKKKIKGFTRAMSELEADLWYEEFECSSLPRNRQYSSTTVVPEAPSIVCSSVVQLGPKVNLPNSEYNEKASRQDHASSTIGGDKPERAKRLSNGKPDQLESSEERDKVELNKKRKMIPSKDIPTAKKPKTQNSTSSILEVINKPHQRGSKSQKLQILPKSAPAKVNLASKNASTSLAENKLSQTKAPLSRKKPGPAKATSGSSNVRATVTKAKTTLPKSKGPPPKVGRALSEQKKIVSKANAVPSKEKSRITKAKTTVTKKNANKTVPWCLETHAHPSDLTTVLQKNACSVRYPLILLTRLELPMDGIQTFTISELGSFRQASCHACGCNRLINQVISLERLHVQFGRPVCAHRACIIEEEASEPNSALEPPPMEPELILPDAPQFEADIPVKFEHVDSNTTPAEDTSYVSGSEGNDPLDGAGQHLVKPDLEPKIEIEEHGIQLEDDTKQWIEGYSLSSQATSSEALSSPSTSYAQSEVDYEVRTEVRQPVVRSCGVQVEEADLAPENQPSPETSVSAQTSKHGVEALTTTKKSSVLEMAAHPHAKPPLPDIIEIEEKAKSATKPLTQSKSTQNVKKELVTIEINKLKEEMEKDLDIIEIKTPKQLPKKPDFRKKPLLQRKGKVPEVINIDDGPEETNIIVKNPAKTVTKEQRKEINKPGVIMIKGSEQDLKNDPDIIEIKEPDSERKISEREVERAPAREKNQNEVTGKPPLLTGENTMKTEGVEQKTCVEVIPSKFKIDVKPGHVKMKESGQLTRCDSDVIEVKVYARTPLQHRRKSQPSQSQELEQKMKTKVGRILPSAVPAKKVEKVSEDYGMKVQSEIDIIATSKPYVRRDSGSRMCRLMVSKEPEHLQSQGVPIVVLKQKCSKLLAHQLSVGPLQMLSIDGADGSLDSKGSFSIYEPVSKLEAPPAELPVTTADIKHDSPDTDQPLKKFIKHNPCDVMPPLELDAALQATDASLAPESDRVDCDVSDTGQPPADNSSRELATAAEKTNFCKVNLLNLDVPDNHSRNTAPLIRWSHNFKRSAEALKAPQERAAQASQSADSIEDSSEELKFSENIQLQLMCNSAFQQQPSKSQSASVQKPSTSQPPTAQPVKRKNWPITCPVCKKIFPNRYRYKIHEVEHSGVKPFKCEICGKNFAIKDQLQVHFRIHMDAYAYQCEFCQKRFTDREQLCEHRRNHEEGGDVPFTCHICNRSFTYKANLAQHILIHSEGQTFKCDLCKKQFKSKIALQSHLKIHMNGSVYRCHLCGKEFKKRKILIGHYISHSIGKFHCEICKSVFKAKGNLRRHLRLHGDASDVYECELCGKQLSGKYHLVRHHQFVHADPKSKSDVDKRNEENLA